MDNQRQQANARQSQTEYLDVLSAAQSLISVLTQTLNQSPVTPRPQVQVQGQGQQAVLPERQTNTTIDQDMARAFPSMFRRHAICGKKRINVASRTHTKNAKAFKPFDLNVYLLDKNSETTPSPAHELKLVQAGFGKRTISITMDITHSELSSILYEAFPKMEGLSGGWMLYKATGGSGTRRLNVIPPDSEGYTGSQIKSASASGKTMLYVVPLQEELDLNPLPNDAREFKKMPKATCQMCNKSMPLQVLALHIQVCKSSDSASSNEETEVQFVSESNLDEITQENFPSESVLPCPICQLKFPVDSLELHASLCGEQNLLESPDHSSFMRNDDFGIADDTTGNSSSPQVLCLDDLLELLAGRVNAENQFRICVSRDNLLERGLKQWQRQKKGNPANQLKITFIGEAGVDSGALRKEFLTEMISGIEKRLFLGQRAKSPQYSNSDLDNGLFRTAGEIFAVSLAQGGPAPCFMREWCYFYLTTGEVDVSRICKDDVDDVEYSLLITKVEEATDLTEFTDEIISCGYTGALNIEQKDAVIRAIVLHATFRVIPMLGDLRKGLQLYGLLDILKEHPSLCKSLFVPGQDCTPDADYILSNVAPEMSERGTSRASVESKIINYFQDFLQEIECGESAEDAAEVETEPSYLTVPRVMQWITGQGHKPLLISEQKAFQIVFKFDHDCKVRMPQHTICFPIVSACTNTVTFPVAHMTTYEDFKFIIVQAIKSGGAFSRV
ncbi:uncharacterized protein LOC113060491 isoform X2 [Carassius auratus]|uniref:Uncharacterized protein LOC113060491 isoform X2 n=1 Tax=Carassius auratus TaxID=7957 RepID=A0A6P6LKV9_CARAU|nr:uncharacterized protein LOC113060491 isoform X2 [Carassius auratus]